MHEKANFRRLSSINNGFILSSRFWYFVLNLVHEKSYSIFFTFITHALCLSLSLSFCLFLFSIYLSLSIYHYLSFSHSSISLPLWITILFLSLLPVFSISHTHIFIQCFDTLSSILFRRPLSLILTWLGQILILMGPSGASSYGIIKRNFIWKVVISCRNIFSLYKLFFSWRTF